MRLATLAVAAVLAACVSPRTAAAIPEAPARSGPYSVELLDESGAVLPTFFHRGRAYVMGSLGRRYLVRVRNASPRRAEVVVSVDGRDVIDGKPASTGKPGYVVDAWGEVVVEGYRLSGASVAAFRFDTVARSYASRMGDARDVGVIGVAVFPEREWRPWPPPPPYRPYDVPGEKAEPRAGSAAAPEAPADAETLRGVPHARREKERRGLGTEFGEERESHAVEVAFERARSRPDAVLTLRYDDRAGLLALGIDVDRRGPGWREDAWLRESAHPFRGSAFAEPPPGWRR
jgi:hypothetical protein